MADPADQGAVEREQTAITDFRFKVCGRCGHPPSDGPCIMGNEEHAKTHEQSFAAFSIVRDLASHHDQALDVLREVETAVRRYRNNHIDVDEMVGDIRQALQSTTKESRDG